MINIPALITAAVLSLAYPAKSPLQKPVAVEFIQQGDMLTANFEVHTPTINAKDELKQGEYPFQFDVVELFVSAEGESTNLPYYEFELTPNNQTFEVKIIDPKTNRIDGVDMGVTYSAKRIRGGWVGQMVIPLRNLGWQGDPKKIVGNAFAVLGKRPNRSYWSLYLPKQKKPNFHLPQYFRPLFENVTVQAAQ